MAYTLVHDAVSHDMVEALEQLLEAAREGQAIGMVFGVMLKRSRYIVDSAGEARKNPTLARGICLAIDDELRDMVQAKGFDETR